MQVGDRVEWESQSQGVWKRKIGTVIEVRKNNLVVAVDTIVDFDPDPPREIGERKRLKTPKSYCPYKRFCRVVRGGV